jgi:hypothetical protein
MTVNIHGKEYRTVAERINEFRSDEDNKGYTIITEIISNDSDYVVMKASIADTDGFVLATGHAQEKYGSTNINQTSALENCETSCIGRALASYGLAGTEFASADEVATAIGQQAEGVSYSPSGKPASDKQIKYIETLYFNEMPDGDLVDYLKNKGMNLTALTSSQASEVIKELS